ncbi:hypothetical protein HW932_15935 [Allochromatium humboldtianum]|uniref:Uncharacterized protein n=1 Tax=Allochromatium humboldtianum TaxID=504901 RepID=A0A850RCZ1_9GAMM|nr:hypothetical protein [Allochromatium humboldtianum]NVZ10755.1 hypothetical protein [Allochromatium humboldtianum]
MTTENTLAGETALATWIASLDEDAKEFFEERAAIVEYDAGQPRAVAEAVAHRLTLLYLQRREVRDGCDRTD